MRLGTNPVASSSAIHGPSGGSLLSAQPHALIWVCRYSQPRTSTQTMELLLNTACSTVAALADYSQRQPVSRPLRAYTSPRSLGFSRTDAPRRETTLFCKLPPIGRSGCG